MAGMNSQTTSTRATTSASESLATSMDVDFIENSHPRNSNIRKIWSRINIPYSPRMLPDFPFPTLSDDGCADVSPKLCEVSKLSHGRHLNSAVDFMLKNTRGRRRRTNKVSFSLQDDLQTDEDVTDTERTTPDDCFITADRSINDVPTTNVLVQEVSQEQQQRRLERRSPLLPLPELIERLSEVNCDDHDGGYNNHGSYILSKDKENNENQKQAKQGRHQRRANSNLESSSLSFEEIIRILKHVNQSVEFETDRQRNNAHDSTFDDCERDDEGEKEILEDAAESSVELNEDPSWRRDPRVRASMVTLRRSGKRVEINRNDVERMQISISSSNDSSLLSPCETPVSSRDDVFEGDDYKMGFALEPEELSCASSITWRGGVPDFDLDALDTDDDDCFDEIKIVENPQQLDAGSELFNTPFGKYQSPFAFDDDEEVIWFEDKTVSDDYEEVNDSVSVASL